MRRTSHSFGPKCLSIIASAVCTTVRLLVRTYFCCALCAANFARPHTQPPLRLVDTGFDGTYPSQTHRSVCGSRRLCLAFRSHAPVVSSVRLAVESIPLGRCCCLPTGAAVNFSGPRPSVATPIARSQERRLWPSVCHRPKMVKMLHAITFRMGVTSAKSDCWCRSYRTRCATDSQDVIVVKFQ